QEEVERAISQASKSLGIKYSEFTVAPLIAEKEGDSCHEWFVEIENDKDVDLAAFASKLDRLVQKQNSYYKDLRAGEILSQAKLTVIDSGGFAAYFSEHDKAGGQNKVQHLANNRELADKLMKYVKNG
ncbi:MAG: hypothetical protein ACI8V8_000164, partial [Chitinophagales bacterium]